MTTHCDNFSNQTCQIFRRTGVTNENNSSADFSECVRPDNEEKEHNNKILIVHFLKNKINRLSFRRTGATSKLVLSPSGAQSCSFHSTAFIW